MAQTVLVTNDDARRVKQRFEDPDAPYEIRAPHQLRDVAAVFHLGEEVFTSQALTTLYRTFDHFVVTNAFSDESLCRLVVLPGAPGVPDRIVGFLLGSLLTKAERRIGYVDWMAVYPGFQRRGLGKALFEEFRTAVIALGATTVTADTQASNEAAVAFLKEVGLTEVVDHVYMSCQVAQTSVSQLRGIDDDDGSINRQFTASRRDGSRVHIKIRNAEIDDLYTIFTIGERVFTSQFPNLLRFWDDAEVLRCYESDPDLCIVAQRDSGEVIGFALGSLIEKSRSAWKYGHLVWQGVDPDYQGLRIGATLVGAFKDILVAAKVRMCLIDTEAANKGALAFFTKLGFGRPEPHLYLSDRKSVV